MVRTLPRAGIPAGRCPRCAFPEALCLCAEVPRLEVPYRFVILRHASELARMTNSGRWAAAALAGAVIHDHALDTQGSDEAVARLLGDGPAALLYTSPRPGEVPSPRPTTIVVPDGTWAQARRMVQRIGPVQRLPRLGLPPAPAGPRLRISHCAEGMTTLEAVAGALDLLGEPAAAARLRALHEVAVERIMRLKGMWPPDRNPHPGTRR